MKKIIAGLGFLFSGTAMYTAVCIAVCANLQYTTEWRTSVGRYWQTVINCGLTPAMIIGLILLIVGAALAFWGVFEKRDGRDV